MALTPRRREKLRKRPLEIIGSLIGIVSGQTISAEAFRVRREAKARQTHHRERQHHRGRVGMSGRLDCYVHAPYVVRWWNWRMLWRRARHAVGATLA
jgi:hypothetical protein